MKDPKSRKVIPITPNTGGIVLSNETVGRELEITLFWEKLHKQGIALFAERRFGKSSILRKMESECKDGYLTIYKPIESVDSTLGFFKCIYDCAKERGLFKGTKIDWFEKSFNKFAQHIQSVASIELKTIEKEWQSEFTDMLACLQNHNPNQIIVIILDEFSIFLDKLETRDAANVIGFLRDVYSDPKAKAIRFVYCGSIGLDLVLDKIKSDGHNIGDPINHMHKTGLAPFTKPNAIYFANCLNYGCDFKLNHNQIKSICKQTDNIPYFIDIVFDNLRKLGKQTNREIKAAFADIIDDTSSTTSLKHFFDRIEHYYPQAKISFHILNFVSLNIISTEEEIANNILSLIEGIDRADVNREIERLKNDNYFIRTIHDGARAYDFKYSLIKLWWKTNKAY